MSRLDLPKVKDINSSTEDKILSLLFVEKGLTKSDISKGVNVNYQRVLEVITLMEEKGFVIFREYSNGNFYYLTREGVREAEYRLNTETYLDIYEYLIGLGYYMHNILNFMKNAFYKYYLEGVWNGNTLESQYLTWCENNNLNPKEKVKKLKK